MDFARPEHESLLAFLANFDGNARIYVESDVREAYSRKKPKLGDYKRDWLDFFSPKVIAWRQERRDHERLTEEEALEDAFPSPKKAAEMEFMSRKDVAREMGDLLPLARKVEGFHRFDPYLDNRLWDWLIPLPLNLATDGHVDEASRLALAWSGIEGEADNLLGDRAVLLAEAGREADAREQVRENLERFPEDVWVRIKGGDSLRALKDVRGAEAFYRESLKMADDRYDREGVLERLIPLLEDTGRGEEASALKAEEDRRDEDENDEPVLPPPTFVREGPKIGRNDPCPCGSGRKFKKCCLDKAPS